MYSQIHLLIERATPLNGERRGHCVCPWDFGRSTYVYLVRWLKFDHSMLLRKWFRNAAGIMRPAIITLIGQRLLQAYLDQILFSWTYLICIAKTIDSERRECQCQKRANRVLPLFSGGKTPDVGSRSFKDIMREQQLKGEESEVSLECALSDHRLNCNYLSAYSFERRFKKRPRTEPW